MNIVKKKRKKNLFVQHKKRYTKARKHTFTFIMKVEINSAADFLMNLLRMRQTAESLTETQLHSFKSQLVSVLHEKFNNHWYTENPRKGKWSKKNLMKNGDFLSISSFSNVFCCSFFMLIHLCEGTSILCVGIISSDYQILDKSWKLSDALIWNFLAIFSLPFQRSFEVC